MTERTYRIMVEQETGEEMCKMANLTAVEACDEAVRLREEHVEWRNVWVELEEDRTLHWQKVYEEDELDLY